MAGISFQDLRDQLNWYSHTVSTVVRATAFGIIAAVWAIFTADGLKLETDNLFGVPPPISVKLAFILAAGALLLDLLQYVAAYWMTNIGVDRREEAEDDTKGIEFFYNHESLGMFGFLLYKTCFFLFVGKMILTIASAILFLVLAFSVTVDDNQSFKSKAAAIGRTPLNLPIIISPHPHEALLIREMHGHPEMGRAGLGGFDLADGVFDRVGDGETVGEVVNQAQPLDLTRHRTG